MKTFSCSSPHNTLLIQSPIRRTEIKASVHPSATIPNFHFYWMYQYHVNTSLTKWSQAQEQLGFSATLSTSLNEMNSTSDLELVRHRRSQITSKFILKTSQCIQVTSKLILDTSHFILNKSQFIPDTSQFIQVTSKAYTKNVPVYLGHVPIYPDTTTTFQTEKVCGKDQGCVRFGRSNCSHLQCDYLLTYNVRDLKYLEMEISGKAIGWSNLGLSSDDKMGGDGVIACKRKSNGDKELEAVTMFRINLAHSRPKVQRQHVHACLSDNSTEGSKLINKAKYFNNFYYTVYIQKLFLL
ncbi:hypothetical protein Btru_029198 [Bulinus truncatus]|nr:hypothetical protein Btru_029198 [Bulinus truncatus]